MSLLDPALIASTTAVANSSLTRAVWISELWLMAALHRIALLINRVLGIGVLGSGLGLVLVSSAGMVLGGKFKNQAKSRID